MNFWAETCREDWPHLEDSVLKRLSNRFFYVPYFRRLKCQTVTVANERCRNSDEYTEDIGESLYQIL